MSRYHAEILGSGPCHRIEVTFDAVDQDAAEEEAERLAALLMMHANTGRLDVDAVWETA